MTVVALTGASGLLGSAIWTACPKSVDLKLHSGPDSPHPKMFISDITDVAGLTRFLEGAEIIIHAAGPPSVAASFRDPVGFVRAHNVGTMAILNAAQSVGVRRIVLISSAEIYGRCPLPVSESCPPAPRSPYAAAKLGAEALCSAAQRSGQIETVILRPFSVYGDKIRRQSVMGDIFAQLANGQTEISLRDIRPVRDYVHTDDVAQAVWAATTCAATSEPQMFNLATGRGTSVGKLARLAGAAIGRQVVPCDTAVPDRPKDADIEELVANVGHARRVLGWQPTISLEVGLLRIFEQFQRSKKENL